MHNINQIRKRAHIRRLNHLLASNNLTQISSEPDGDCFFNSISCQISSENYTVSSLRARVCEHLLQNESHYIDFLHFQDNLSPEQKAHVYKEKVREIETPGTWNNDISDIIPLAISNIFKKHITIFSSRINNPVTNIAPTMRMPANVQGPPPPIMLSFLAMHGFEHYDCVIKSPSPTGNPSLFTSLKAPSNQCLMSHRSTSVTPRKKADYKSPEKKRTSRKKTADPSKWKKILEKITKSWEKAIYHQETRRQYPQNVSNQ